MLAWISLPLAAGLVSFAIRGHRQGRRSRKVRGIYGLAAVAAVIFAGFLVYWNVLTIPL